MLFLCILFFYNLVNSPAAIAVIQSGSEISSAPICCNRVSLLVSLHHYFQNLIPHCDPSGHYYFHLHTTLIHHLCRPLPEPHIKLSFQLKVHVLLFPHFVWVMWPPHALIHGSEFSYPWPHVSKRNIWKRISHSHPHRWNLHGSRETRTEAPQMAKMELLVDGLAQWVHFAGNRWHEKILMCAWPITYEAREEFFKVVAVIIFI